MGRCFSTRRFDGKTQLYLYPDLYRDIEIGSELIGVTRSPIEEIVDKEKVVWNKKVFCQIFNALTKQSLHALKVYPHCPLFKTAVLCRSAARCGVSPSVKFITAMGENRPCPAHPGRQSVNFISPRFDKDGRDFVQLMFIHLAGFGCFIMDFAANKDFKMTLQPLYAYSKHGENQPYKTLRHGEDVTSLKWKDYVLVWNLLCEFLHAGCRSIAFDKKVTSRAGDPKVTRATMEEKATALTCKWIVFLLRNLMKDDAPSLLSKNVMGFGHVATCILNELGVNVWNQFGVNGSLSALMSKGVSCSKDFFSQEKPSSATDNAAHKHPRSFSTPIPWETKVLGITYSNLGNPGHSFQEEETETLRGQQVWALLEDLYSEIRDAVSDEFNHGRNDWDCGVILKGGRDFEKGCLNVDLKILRSQPVTRVLYLCQIHTDHNYERRTSRCFTALCSTKHRSVATFLLSSFSDDTAWLKEDYKISFCPILQLTTFCRQYDALQKFELLHPSLRKLIFKDEESELERIASTQCSGDYLTETEEVCSLYALNEYQRNAVISLGDLRTRVVKPLSGIVAVQGPPGTGKSSTIEAMLCFLLRRKFVEPRDRIVVCAPSNAAVDSLLNRIHQKSLKGLQEALRLVRVGSNSTSAASPDLSLDTLASERDGTPLGGIPSLSTRKMILEEADIIFGTNASMGSPELLRIFPSCAVIIVDEAAACTIPSVLIPIVSVAQKSVPGHGVVSVLVGDPCQLPAVVKTKHPTAKQILEHSLLEEVLQHQSDHLKHVFLNTQYRMHPKISEIVSQCFYNGRLSDAEGLYKNGVSPAAPYNEHSGGKYGPVAFYNIQRFKKGSELSAQGNVSQNTNRAEADFIVGLIESLVSEYHSYDFQGCISVVSAYHDQVSTLRRCLTIAKIPEDIKRSIDVSTIDAMQSKEKDIVFVSTVRSGQDSPGFLDNNRRVNVAISRSRNSLIIVGDVEFLQNNCLTWKRVVDKCKDIDALFNC